jgi:hypothetical protein
MIEGEHSMKHRKTLLIISMITVIALLMITVLYIVLSWSRQIWRDHPLSDPTIGFQLLIPRRLPSDFHISAKRIDIKHGAYGKLKSVAVEMNLRTEDWVYGIQELRATNENTSTSLHNFDPTSISTSCDSKSSPDGQPYCLCHWVDYGKISVYEVELIKQGVYIHTTFPTTIDHILSDYELGSFVDSFQPGDPSGIPVLDNAV